MAIIAPLFAFVGRFIGKVVQTIFGWATLMLFGRVPQSKQLLLAGVSLGAVAWVVAIIGVIVPDIGAFLLTLVPAPDVIDDNLLRLAMLVLALALPLAIGLGGLFLMDEADRPDGIGGKVVGVLRGYPYAAVLSVVILFLLVVAPIFKLRTILKRWEDAHIPIIVKPDGYEQVAGELESAIDAAGLNLERTPAPRVLEAPSRLLAFVGGASVRRLVPDRLVKLKAPSLEVQIHPSDVAISGSKESVARARAAIADRLTKTDAYLTIAEESQEIEDELRHLRAADATSGRARAAALAGLPSIDVRLARLTVPYDEWEVLYRQRLQVERDLLRGDPALRSDPADGEPSLLERVGRAVDALIG